MYLKTAKLLGLLLSFFLAMLLFFIPVINPIVLVLALGSGFNSDAAKGISFFFGKHYRLFRLIGSLAVWAFLQPVGIFKTTFFTNHTILLKISFIKEHGQNPFFV